MSSPVPESVKRNVRAVLLSKVGGVPLSRVIQDYRSLTLEQLDYKGLGYQTLKAFLESMPEIARLEQTGSDTKVFGVSDPNTYLPIGARKAQGRLPKDYHKKIQAAKTGCPEAPEESTASDMDLEPDQNGLFSVCCPIQRAPSDKLEIENLFNQVGAVVRIFKSPKWVFVRYKTREEVYKAMEVFGDEMDLRIPHNMKEKTNGYATDTEYRKKKPQRVEKTFNGPKPNGYHHENGSPKKHEKEHGGPVGNSILGRPNSGQLDRQNGMTQSPMTTQDEKQDGLKTLFVNGISDKAAFHKLIEPYKPVNVKFAVNKKRTEWWNGFLEMSTTEDAQRVIKDLNKKQLGSNYIIVDYDSHEQKSDSIMSFTGKAKKDFSAPANENKPSQTRPDRPGEKPIQKPPQRSSEFMDMPPLIPVSASSDDPNYYMDCTVFVGHFEANTTLGAFQDAFSKYHLKDIYIANNNFLEGCTRAFLYLSSISDVIRCVEEMNGVNIGDRIIKVDVPYKNEKMRFVLKSRLKLKTQEEARSIRKQQISPCNSVV